MTALNDLAELFIKSVATNRNVSVEKVKKQFGRGWTVVGNKAIQTGMADEIYNLYNNKGEINNMGKTAEKTPVEIEASAETSPTIGVNEIDRIKGIVSLCETPDELFAVKGLLTDSSKTQADALSVLLDAKRAELQSVKSSQESFKAQYFADAKEVPAIAKAGEIEINEEEQAKKLAKEIVGEK